MGGGTMETRIGGTLFALFVGALGVQCLLVGQYVHGLQPMPAHFPPTPGAWVTGAVLIAAGVSLLWKRTARIGAIVLAALFFLSVAVLYTPMLVANLKNAADDALHTLGFGAAALILVAPKGRAGLVGRLIFGVCLIGYGVMHFVFFQFTADFVPAWIPLHGFWAAFTGLAQIAAGFAVLSGVLARLAAILAAVMYGSWALILHLPKVVASPATPSEWTDMLIATGLCAASLLVAGSVLARDATTP
jgi:uncharacterized membrane protein YphA (DoxX/SURF4 family)